MKKTVSLCLVLMALLAAGCGSVGGNSQGSTSSNAKMEDVKAQAVEKLQQMKKDTEKLQKQIVENAKEIKGNLQETAKKVEQQIEEVKKLAKENKVTERDAEELKVKLQSAMEKLKQLKK